jgi:hypothetical protein
MEVAGAAMGSVLGVAAELAILLAVGLRKNYISLDGLKTFRQLTKAFVARFLKVVLPVVGNEMLWALGVVAYAASYGNMAHPAVATAAVNIYNNVEQLASVILRGTTQAAAIMIGMSIGAGREADARREAMRLLLLNVAVAALTAVPSCSSAEGSPALPRRGGDQAERGAPDPVLRVLAAADRGQFARDRRHLPAGRGLDVLDAPRHPPDVAHRRAAGVLAALVFRWPVEYVYLVTVTEYAVKWASASGGS